MKKKQQEELVVLSRGERLRDSRRQGTSMTLPLAVHHRLDLLTEAAEDTEPTRAEIIGMLISFAELDTERLERDVLRYRKLKVGDVVPDELDSESEPEPHDIRELDNVVSIRKRGPGRPARHEAG
jgi:hypothetical protein